jgi:hypothetical protein
LLLGGELLDRSRSQFERSPGGAWGEQVMWYLPYSYIGEGMDRINRNGGRGTAFTWYRNVYFRLPCDPLASPPPNSQGSALYYSSSAYQRQVNFPQYVLVVLTVGGLYVIAALGLLLWTAHRFDRMVGRARQLEKSPPAAPARGLLDGGSGVTRVTLGS